MNKATHAGYSYSASKPRARRGDDVIAEAVTILERRLRRSGEIISNPSDISRWLQLNIGHLEREVFWAIWLNNRHRVVGYEELFSGTISGASVHPREVVKSAMRHNAAACILAHNHPSGDPEPSQSDRQITLRLRDALALVDVRCLDHLVVGFPDVTSLAERGLL